MLQFTRHVTKALRCNGFVVGPNSLQFTGRPFAKPHVPCVVASQLCFVHERASTSSCWSVKSSCKHEIYPDLAWHVNCNLKLLTPPVRGPIMCRITRNRINVFYFFDSRRCCTSTCRRLCLNLWSDIIIAYPLKSYKRTNAFLCTFFNTSGVQPSRLWMRRSEVFVGKKMA